MKCDWPRPKAGLAGAALAGRVCRGGQSRGHRGGKPGGVRRCRGKVRAAGGLPGRKADLTGAENTHRGAIQGDVSGKPGDDRAKSRADRGKKHTGAGFSGRFFAEKAATWAKKAALGRPAGAKSPRKPGLPGEKSRFPGDISSGRDGFADALTRTYAYARAHRQARFRACIGRKRPNRAKATKVCPLCRRFVAVCYPFVIWTFSASGVMNVSARRARPQGRPNGSPSPKGEAP